MNPETKFGPVLDLTGGKEFDDILQSFLRTDAVGIEGVFADLEEKSPFSTNESILLKPGGDYYNLVSPYKKQELNTYDTSKYLELITPPTYIEKETKNEFIYESKHYERVDNFAALGKQALKLVVSNSNPNITVPTSIKGGYDLGRNISAEQLAEMAVPIVDFIREVRPHIVVGCDRGGRLFSLAVHATWRELEGNAPFPTVDGKVHFARISKSETESVLQKHFDVLVAKAHRQAEIRGASLDDEKLRILFIDDWVAGGGTRRLTERLAAPHGAQTYFAVMRGGRADVSGMPGDNWAKPAWSDDSETIGVNYVSISVEDEEGGYQTVDSVQALRNDSSRRVRRRMYGAVKQLSAPTEELLAA